VPAGRTQSDASLQNRAGAAEVALAIFADHPLAGVGGDNYPVVYFPYALRLNTPGAASRSHDLYLQVAAETGLLGLITFGSVIVLALRACWRRRSAAIRAKDRMTEGLVISCLLALAAYLIGSVFLPAAYPRYLWILIGLVMAATLPRLGHGERRFVPGALARTSAI
jgi:O-antigen ligase